MKTTSIIKTLALTTLASMTFACAAPADGEAADEAATDAQSDTVKVAASGESVAGSLPREPPSNAVSLTFGSRQTTDSQGATHDGADFGTSRFEVIDTCVTPGQAYDQLYSQVDKHSWKVSTLNANLPADRKGSSVCADWFKQTIARGQFETAELGVGVVSQVPGEFNLAFRGNLHVYFMDGTEVVHQVVLAQGHDGLHNPWWVAIEGGHSNQHGSIDTNDGATHSLGFDLQIGK
jgi:hypothetical protein